MLRNILKTWPQIRILPETHFLVPLYNRYGVNEITYNQFIEIVDNIHSQSGNKFILGILKDASKKYETYKKDFLTFLNDNNIRGNIKDYTEAFFEFLYGKDVLLGDKTPHYGIHAQIIKELWPDAKFLHIFRDGVDVAHSMLSHGGFINLISNNIAPRDIDEYMYGKDIGSSPKRAIQMTESLLFWKEAINDTIKSLNIYEDGIDFINVRYEDILFFPEQEITKVASFLGVDDKLNLKKAIIIPRPFPEKNQVKKLDSNEYDKYYECIKDTMKSWGYPYKVVIKRTLIQKIKEVYRGRYNYILSLKKNLKIFLKKQ